ncbi:MAG: hypothetical protein COA58_01740 [Bacteroidetes bacterium]|nr:MAG: hypothetical protein COA58_01740 [Bacteroidota bacterium]
MQKGKRNKLAVVFSGDFPEGNTKNARLKIIANELKEKNWDCYFLSAFPYKFSKTLNHKQPKRWNGFKIIFFSLSRKYPILFPLRALQISLAQVVILYWTIFRAHHYTAFYYYNPRWTDTLLSLYVNTLLGRKCIVDQTELFSSGGNKKWHESEEKIIAKRATVLFVISKKLEEHYKTIRSRPTYLFPILIDTERFKTDTKEQNGLMGYIGSFAAKDGIYLLLEALRILIQNGEELTLRLIGYNPEVDKLKAKVKEMGIEDRVEITGTVTYKEIPWLLNECDTLLMNRDSSNFSTYGYPIKLGEYFACLKPVVMSDGKGFSEDFEDRNEVFKYEVDNAISLAEVLTYRYRSIGESDAIAKRGQQYALDYFDSVKLGGFLSTVLNEL